MYQPQNRMFKQFTLIASAIIALSALSARPALAQVNEPSMIGKTVEKINPVNWKIPSFRLPNFLVGHDEQDRIVERKNGLFADIKGTASRSWQRTKQTFNPARLNPMNLLAGPSASTATPNDAKKPGFFSSLMSPPAAEPAERVASVNEFLGQKRP